MSQDEIRPIAESKKAELNITDKMKSGILVKTRKHDEIAYALEFMHKNLEKTRIFGQNLRQKAEHEFSLEKMIEETIAVYESRTK